MFGEHAIMFEVSICRGLGKLPNMFDNFWVKVIFYQNYDFDVKSCKHPADTFAMNKNSVLRKNTCI